MKVNKLKLKNFRSFQELTELIFSDKINVFVGRNNSGKSTLLDALANVQNVAFQKDDLRYETESGFIENIITIPDSLFLNHKGVNEIRVEVNRNEMYPKIYVNSEESSQLINSFQTPFFKPFFSQRKLYKHKENGIFLSMSIDINNIASLTKRIDSILMNPYKKSNNLYKQMCKEILGFEVHLGEPYGEKIPVCYVNENSKVPVTKMGEGIMAMLTLIIELCTSENCIFILEEPENDIHPKALKSLLRLIVESSSSNQFFVSTHSNIVMKYLGSEDSTNLFKVYTENNSLNEIILFDSKVKNISNDEFEKKLSLEELGYEFYDYNLWEGWIFFEESSAERIVRDYFFKWFTPKLLNKVRTFSTNGKDQLDIKFDDFNRLFVYLHLETTYKNKAWVIIDGGVHEKIIIDTLREKYTKSGWDSEHFLQFNKHDFEEYYPARFQSKFLSDIKNERKKREKMDKKKQLLLEVIEWIKLDEKTAKDEFEESAREIVNMLKVIECKLNIQ